MFEIRAAYLSTFNAGLLGGWGDSSSFGAMFALSGEEVSAALSPITSKYGFRLKPEFSALAHVKPWRGELLHSYLDTPEKFKLISNYNLFLKRWEKSASKKNEREFVHPKELISQGERGYAARASRVRSRLHTPSPKNLALTVTAASAVNLVPFQFDVLKEAHDLQFTGWGRHCAHYSCNKHGNRHEPRE